MVTLALASALVRMPLPLDLSQESYMIETRTGPNAVRALRYMGILDDLRAQLGDGAPLIRPFTCVLGENPQAVVYQVRRVIHQPEETSLILVCTVSIQTSIKV